MSSVLEVGATQTVPDDVRHLLHQLPAGAAGEPAVLRQVHGAADLGGEALVQCRDHPQLHRGEARVGAVRLQGFEPHPRDVDGHHPVDGQEMLDESQDERQEGEVGLRLAEFGVKELHYAVDPPQGEVLLLGRVQTHGGYFLLSCDFTLLYLQNRKIYAGLYIFI